MKNRIRRSRLYLPGNNPNLMENAFLFGADCLILDLEDSVPLAEKLSARVLVKYALKYLNFGSSEKIVRINPLESPFGKFDLEMIIPMEPDTILIPKRNLKEDVINVDEIIQEIRSRYGIKKEIFLMPLIETAKGIWHSYDIAMASPNVCALCFGAEDFTADIGAERTREGHESFVARSMIVLGAKAAGVQAIDTVWSDIQDEEGLVASAKEAKMMGFEGKGIIHPAQIEPVNRVFTPSQEEIEYAHQVLKAIEEAKKKGLAVASVGRKMIDPPVVERAKRVLNLAKITT
ncbi:HpcH/HpaI aldolase/citrate lyase family protein [bacterium]|nr:HpcH/HpaI aldolase/citrate lyase family protein [bacterium]